jgi:acyl carrier protein
MGAVTTEEVRDLLLDGLNLREDYRPEEIDLEGPLFGDGGLGLDSLDALQLAVALEERWGVTVDEGLGPTVFRSCRSIAEHVNSQRAGAPA